VGVQEVRWEGSGTAPAGENTFFYGKGNENHELGIGFISAVKRVEFGSDVINNTERSLVSYYCSEFSCPNRE
jgi:hypothetical protein